MGDVGEDKAEGDLCIGGNGNATAATADADEDAADAHDVSSSSGGICTRLKLVCRRDEGEGEAETGGEATAAIASERASKQAAATGGDVRVCIDVARSSGRRRVCGADGMNGRSNAPATSAIGTGEGRRSEAHRRQHSNDRSIDRPTPAHTHLPPTLFYLHHVNTTSRQSRSTVRPATHQATRSAQTQPTQTDPRPPHRLCYLLIHLTFSFLIARITCECCCCCSSSSGDGGVDGWSGGRPANRRREGQSHQGQRTSNQSQN